MLAWLWTLMQLHGGATKHWRESGCARCACKWEIKGTDSSHVVQLTRRVCWESPMFVREWKASTISIVLLNFVSLCRWRRGEIHLFTVHFPVYLNSLNTHNTKPTGSLASSRVTESMQEFIRLWWWWVYISTTLKQNKNIFFFPGITPSLWWQQTHQFRI